MRHIVILFTDQQRWDTVSAFGRREIQTPNLDALARESDVFTNCYTPSPVCVPARLSLFSGQYPSRTGCNNNNTDKVYSGDGFYSRLTERGYNSCAVGKMHYLWAPYSGLGFERRFTQEEMPGEEDDYARYIRAKYPWIYDLHGMRSEMYYMPQISQLPPFDHPTQWVGDRSVEFIESAGDDRPIFLFASFIHPHPPYCPPAPWQKLYRDDPDEPFVPEGLDGFSELIGSRCSCERLQMSRQDVLRTKNYYYSCVSFVDYQVGRIIRALKERGIYDDTLILFSSDHGDLMGDYSAIGKRTMVDSASRIPFMIRRPHLPGGIRRDVCSLVDVAPTLLSYAGADYSADEFDGTDLYGHGSHKYVFSQYGCGKQGTYMVTDGEKKLVYRAASDRYYYFDSLPEARDVYSEHSGECAELREALDAYRQKDRNESGESRTYEPVTKTHPHYPGRMDQALFRDAERAAIPEPYRIDLS